MKINKFRGEVTDILAKKEALLLAFHPSQTILSSVSVFKLNLRILGYLDSTNITFYVRNKYFSGRSYRFISYNTNTASWAVHPVL